jgi:hypothetical protein
MDASPQIRTLILSESASDKIFMVVTYYKIG